MSRSLTLYIPGLLGSWEPIPKDQSAALLPQMPGLTQILNQAEREPVAILDPEEQALAWFGIDKEAEKDQPIAAIEKAASQGYWLKAEPVIFHADRDRLMLFDGDQAQYSEEESQALIDAMNESFAEFGWHFEGRYLRLPEDPGFTTTPLRHALGRSVDRLLPRGPDAAKLHSRLTELEMLMHAHPVNQKKQMLGQASVDGVWLWGGGYRPELNAGPFDGVFDDRALMKGLAGGTAQSVPATAADLISSLADGENLLSLMHVDQANIYGDMRSWLEALPVLDQQWLQPLAEAVSTGTLERLHLLAGDGYRHTRSAHIPLLKRLRGLLPGRQTTHWSHSLKNHS